MNYLIPELEALHGSKPKKAVITMKCHGCGKSEDLRTLKQFKKWRLARDGR